MNQPIHLLLKELEETPSSVELITQINEHACSLYWKDKDVHASLGLLDAASKIMEAKVEWSVDAQLTSLLAGLKMMLYNLASFGWRGWGEDWAIISEADEQKSAAAAQRHLEIAMELNLAPLMLARAYWIAGAHAMQAGHLQSAEVLFGQSALSATQANEIGDAMNAEAFRHVCSILVGKGAAEDAFRQHLERMAEVPEAKEFIDQSIVALRVFRREINTIPES